MNSISKKSFENPDEVRPFDQGTGRMELVSFDGGLVGRGTFEPGWQWSKHVKPIAGTASCQSAHMGYVVSGRMKVVMDGGQDAEFGPGDVMEVPPGHDAWIVGDQPCVIIDWQGVVGHAERS
jgi:quercetin dioxygenase-like cupin family protein